jgi:uncharacterized protein
MKCPIDDTELVMAERQGIEIDYCPKCRGVWLDRGELDKIIDRSAQEAAPQAPRFAPPPQQHRPSDPHQHRHEPYGEPRHKKKKSLLGEIFDF